MWKHQNWRLKVVRNKYIAKARLSVATWLVYPLMFSAASMHERTKRLWNSISISLPIWVYENILLLTGFASTIRQSSRRDMIGSRLKRLLSKMNLVELLSKVGEPLPSLVTQSAP